MRKFPVKIICHISLFILFSYATIAKAATIDSLTKALVNVTSDSIRCELLNKIAWEYKFSNPDTSIYLANAAMKISKKNNILKETGNAQNTLGVVEYLTGNYKEAFLHLYEAFKINTQLGDEKTLAKIFNNLGLICSDQGNYPKSLEYHLKSLKISEHLNNKSGISASLNNIGTIYRYQGNYRKAQEYFFKSLHINQSLDNKQEIANNLNNIGTVLSNTEKQEEALKYFFQSLALEQQIGNKKFEYNCMLNIGSIYMNQNKYSLALSFLNNALEGKKVSGDEQGIPNILLNIGYIYLKQKEQRKAIDFMKRSLTESLHLESNEDIKESYRGLTDAYEFTNDCQNAFFNYKQFNKVKDSIMNADNMDKIANMQTIYETEKKDNEIQLLNKDKEIQKAEITRQTLIKNAVIGGVSIAGIFSFLLVRSYSRRRKTAFDKQVSEVEMKALRSQMNPHFIFNSLHSINKYMLDNDKQNASEFLSKFSKLMRLILENSREQEVPLEKDLSALELYMQLEALRFQNKFRYQLDIDPDIDPEIALIPPMILQPFVENSILHGLRTKENGLIKITIAKENEMMRCSVEDNGVGRKQTVKTEEEEQEKRESLGMKITQERLTIISQLKKVEATVSIADLMDTENNPCGLRVELLLPFETAF